NYCETDVLNTYLVYLHWELTRGNFTEAGLKKEFELVKKHLGDADKPHLSEFLETWNKNSADL
ncbi:MAG: 3'-5' exonuclease, partial [Acidiferrobacterales bacterium]